MREPQLLVSMDCIPNVGSPVLSCGMLDVEA